MKQHTLNQCQCAACRMREREAEREPIELTAEQLALLRDIVAVGEGDARK